MKNMNYLFQLIENNSLISNVSNKIPRKNKCQLFNYVCLNLLMYDYSPCTQIIFHTSTVYDISLKIKMSRATHRASCNTPKI